MSTELSFDLDELFREIEERKEEWDSESLLVSEETQEVFCLSQVEYKHLEEDKERLCSNPSLYSDANALNRINLEYLFCDESEIPTYVPTIWYGFFPINFYTARKIVATAMRIPKEKIRPLFFPLGFGVGIPKRKASGPLTGDEDSGDDFDQEKTTSAKQRMFEMLCEIGESVGLRNVGEKLYDGACAGDPRAVKLYYELMGGIGVPKEKDDEKDSLPTMRILIED